MAKVNYDNDKLFDENSVEDLIEKDILTRGDIQIIFDCRSDKALRLLKLMKQTSYAVKIGKNYYISKKALLQFMDDFEGKEVFI